MNLRVLTMAALIASAACGHPNPPVDAGDDGLAPDGPTIGSPCSTEADCPPSTSELPFVACVYSLSDGCAEDAGKTCQQHPTCFSSWDYYTCDGGIVTVECPSDGFTFQQVAGPVPSLPDGGAD